MNLKNYYQIIEDKLKLVKKYIDTWQNYEALFQIDLNSILSVLEDDIDSWYKMLSEIEDGQ